MASSRALSLDQSPPIEAPLRFFLTAPLYGVAAGVTVAARAETVTASRWAPDTLAAVHLVALGFMLQVMAGALLQLLPVAVGAAVPLGRPIAALTHAGLNAGTVLLAAAFLGGGAALFPLAAAVLVVTLLAYASALSVALWRSRAVGPTLLALRLAALALAVTAGLGFTLASALGLSWNVPFIALTNVHAAWGLLGFALCLLAAVSYLVVPMFQLTPGYPVAVARALPLALGAGLVAWSWGVPSGQRPLALAGAALLAAATWGFVLQTVRLRRSSKRRVRDATFWAFRLGLLSLSLAAAAAAGAYLSPPGPWSFRLEYLAGVFVLAGAFPAFISGMLFKILPFLVWLHLSRSGPGAPLMHEVLRPQLPRAQVLTHGAAVLLLCAGAAAPGLAAAGGVAFAASHALLAWTLVSGLSVYRAGLRARAPTPA